MAEIDTLIDLAREILNEMSTLPQRMSLAAGQVTVVHGLSDVSESLGTVVAGEFRVGNQLTPGFGFTGVRMAYPGMVYGGQEYHIVGVNNDVLQFGLRATDGVAVAGAGAVTLDADGITIHAQNGTDPTEAVNRVNFIHPDNGTELVYLGATYTNTMTYQGFLGVVTGGSSVLNLLAETTLSGDTASVYLEASNSADANLSSILIGNTGGITLNGGLHLGSATGASNGSMAYSGNLRPSRNSVLHTAYAFVPLDTPLTSTSYDGNDAVNIGTYTIDTSVTFGATYVPKAWLVRMSCEFAAAADTNILRMQRTGQTTSYGTIRAQVVNFINDVVGIVPADANGDFDIQVLGANAASVSIVLLGYFI